MPKRLKKGTLICGVSRNDHKIYLYDVDKDSLKKDFVSLQPSNVSFENDDFGVILDFFREKITTKKLYKIITHRGIGWIHECWIKDAKSS